MKRTRKYRTIMTANKTITFILSLVAATLFFGSWVDAQTIRPLSKGWYRPPYEDGTELLSGSLNLFSIGHNGYDLVGLPAYKLLAMADGEVVEVEDGYDECGLLPLPCTPDVGGGCPCNNKIWIDHMNGEFSAYYHLAYDSAQVQVGDWVTAGQYIADEGDVGSTGSSDSVINRPKLGCNGDQDPNGYCGMHLHFAVSTRHIDSMHRSVLVIPRICGIPKHVIDPNIIIPASDVGPCNPGICPSNVTISGNFTGTQEVFLSNNTITTLSTQVIQNSVIGYEAGQKVTLNPGFRAAAGCYFRASIGNWSEPGGGCP
jgi:hypothetical protein